MWYLCSLLRYKGRDMLRVIVLTTALILADANPTCEFSGEQSQDLVCKPGFSDFVLERGLISNNRQVRSVTLKGCRITEVEYEAFYQLLSIEHLDLSHNKIKTLKLGVLDDIRQLKFLNLSNNQLTELKLGLFDQVPNLQILDLSANELKRLELGILDNFNQMTLLNLSHNQLIKFPLGIFDKNPNLEILDLKGNSINELELGILDNFKKLKHLDMSSNVILGKNLSAYVFDQSPIIQVLDFSWNDMTGSDDILLHAFTALDFLSLERCSLTEVPNFAVKPNLKTMKHLILSLNKISTIDDPKKFENLENLEILNLDGNSISKIAEGAFAPLANLKIVKLSHNRLKQLSMTMFQNLVKLGNVDLSYNALEIVPVNAFRGAPIKNLNLSNNKFTYLPDNFCLELRNSGGKLSKFYFNHNPWQCSCLRDIINEVKMFDITYNNAKYHGVTPACVTGNDFNCKRSLETNVYFMELYNDLISPGI